MLASTLVPVSVLSTAVFHKWTDSSILDFLIAGMGQRLRKRSPGEAW